MSIYKPIKLGELFDMDIPPEEFLSSHISAIDQIVGGFCRRELSIMSAPTCNGKSFVSLSAALNMAQEYNVFYVSLENGSGTDFKRIQDIISYYNLDRTKLRFSYMNKELFENDDKMLKLDELDDISKYSISSFKMKDLNEILKANSYDVVFIDSIDFFGDVNSTDGMNSFNTLNIICEILRQLAKLYNCAIIATSQLNRGSIGKEIEVLGVGDIQGSFGIAQKAYSVWIMSRDNWAIKLAKNRGERKMNIEIGYMNNGDPNNLDIEYCQWNKKVSNNGSKKR